MEGGKYVGKGVKATSDCVSEKQGDVLLKFYIKKKKKKEQNAKGQGN